MPSLFDDAAENVGSCEEVPTNHATDRLTGVQGSLATNARRWINLGKPVAVAVAKAYGKVTAETFRDEAKKRGKLPATHGDQRSLSYLAVMFRELCKEGHLEKRRRGDGSIVKEYSKEQSNDQVVYQVPG